MRKNNKIQIYVFRYVLFETLLFPMSPNYGEKSLFKSGTDLKDVFHTFYMLMYNYTHLAYQRKTTQRKKLWMQTCDNPVVKNTHHILNFGHTGFLNFMSHGVLS